MNLEKIKIIVEHSQIPRKFKEALNIVIAQKD